jgi:DNA ligase-1
LTQFKGVMLAHSWDEQQDITGWLMSEKLDGVHGVWYPDENVMVSRNGNEFYLPQWLKKKLPKLHLAGELWMGRGKFQATSGIVRQHDESDPRWKGVKYMVFDAPMVRGDAEYRLLKAQQACARVKGGAAVLLAYREVKSVAWAKAQCKAITKSGGEGVMFLHPNAPYEYGRSQYLLKYKLAYTAEAAVCGHEPGEGKHKGRLGALVCHFNGKGFNIGTGFSDAEREDPPKVGKMVTFRCNGFTDDGIPRFPAFVAERNYE